MSEYKKPESKADLSHNFEQLKPYMNATMAHYESSRCLYCYDAPCVKACPTEIDIPLFIRQIHTGNVKGAAKTIYDSNYFGNICGKVCPTEELCEGACVYNHQDVKPIEIGRLQSFATSQVVDAGTPIFNLKESNSKKVAIIGAGPAGISCACELRQLGYTVDIFEAKSRPSGLALYGCAPYKVTNEDIQKEVQYLQVQFGFKLHLNKAIQAADLKQLEADYDAIFLGIGLGETRSIGVKRDSLKGVIGATEFIEQVKIDPLNTKVGKRVVVIGGGNTAMDAASEAARLGAKKVVLAYRRSKEEMGAYHFEYELAKNAGVKGLFNVSPSKIGGKKRVKSIQFHKTKQVNGHLQIDEKSALKMKCDMIILATGQLKQIDFLKEIPNLELESNGKIKTNVGLQTTNPKYFAGGDAVNGGAEVVNAAADGKKAAQGIHQFIQNS